MKKQISFYLLKPLMMTRAFKKAIPVVSLVFISMLFFSSNSFAQDKIAVSAIQKDTSKTVWHTLKTVGSVTISYQYVDCGPVEFIQFKIENTSSDKVAVSWTYKQFNNGTEATLNADMAKVNYTVNAGSTLAGACYSENTKLCVFVRESGMVLMVTDIELTDINVSISQ